MYGDISNLIVVKHNKIIDAEYSMGVCEQRVLLTCISKIDSSKELPENHIFTVSVDDIVDLVDVDRNSTYRHLKNTCDSLFANVIQVELPELQEVIKARWVYMVRYIEKEGKVELRFTPEIMPFLTKISRNFTKYKLAHVLKFKSAYSFRLYELLCRWGGSEYTISIDWLRGKFQLTDKYERIVDFKNNVIDIAVKEINATSDIKVTYEQVKKGRNIVALKFVYIRPKDTTLLKKAEIESLPLLEIPASKPAEPETINIDIKQFSEKDKQLAQGALAKVPLATQRIIMEMFKSALAKGDVKYPLRYLNSLVGKALTGDLDITSFEAKPTSSNYLERQARRAEVITQVFAKNADEIRAKLADDGHVFISGEGTVTKSEFEALGLIERSKRSTKKISLSELMEKAQEQENLRKTQEIVKEESECNLSSI